jgi:hypothetical protein
LLRRAFVFNLDAFSMLFFRNGTVAEGNRGIEGSLEMLKLLASWSTPDPNATLRSAGFVALALAAAIHFTPARWIHERLRERWNALPSAAQAFSLVALAGTLAALSYAKAPFKYFQF